MTIFGGSKNQQKSEWNKIKYNNYILKFPLFLPLSLNKKKKSQKTIYWLCNIIYKKKYKNIIIKRVFVIINIDLLFDIIWMYNMKNYLNNNNEENK